MAWSDRFLRAIDAELIEPLYLLESVQIGTFDPTSTDLRLSSFDAAGYLNCITREGSSVTYGELTPGSWARSYGTLNLGITAHTELRALIARGMAVQLRIGFAGWELDQFECVWLGVVRNLRWSTGAWVLECAELAGALQNRFDDTSSQQNLFYELPITTKLTADYDPSLDDPATGFEVDDSTGWQANNTGDYVARITPTGGNFYYATASSLASDTFTGTNGGVFDSPLDSAKHPAVTTPEPASTNDQVEAIAWVQAHPINFANILLVSTGTGDNGPQDLLPASWGWGIPYGLVDTDDCDAFKALSSPSSGGTHWDFLVDHSQSDGMSWLTEQLRPGGFFLATFQGRLTCRAVLTNTGHKTPGWLSITDDDLMAIDYECWDSTSQVEYRNVRVLGYNEADPAVFFETTLATRPTRTSRRRDLPQAFSLVSAGWTDEVSKRLGKYDTRVPERLALTVRGWRAARASLGELVFLTTNYLDSRSSATAVDGDGRFDATASLVVGGGCDWFGSSTKLDVLVIPEFAGLN